MKLLLLAPFMVFLASGCKKTHKVDGVPAAFGDNYPTSIRLQFRDSTYPLPDSISMQANYSLNWVTSYTMHAANTDRGISFTLEMITDAFTASQNIPFTKVSVNFGTITSDHWLIDPTNSPTTSITEAAGSTIQGRYSVSIKDTTRVDTLRYFTVSFDNLHIQYR